MQLKVGPYSLSIYAGLSMISTVRCPDGWGRSNIHCHSGGGLTPCMAVQERGALPRGRPTPGGEDWLANPVLPEDILREAVSLNPGCILHVQTHRKNAANGGVVTNPSA